MLKDFGLNHHGFLVFEKENRMRRLINFYLCISGMFVIYTSSIADELLWTKLDGPYGGGKITSLLQDKDGTIWAGADHFGLFKSNDLGQNWTQLPIPDLFGRTVTCMDDQGDVLFIGTWGPTILFNKKNLNFQGGWLGNVREIEATSEQNFYALTYTLEDRNKIYYIGPPTGTKVIVPREDAEYIADIDVTADGTLYALVSDRLLRSSDHGDTWEDLSPSGGFRLAGFLTSLEVKEDGNIFILNGGYPGYYFDDAQIMGYFYHYSPKMGWTTKQTVPIDFCDVKSLQVNGDIITVSPAGYSLDNGDTWRVVQFNDSAPYSEYRALLYIPDEQFMASTGLNLFFSADLGITWQLRNHGLYFGTQLDIHPGGDLYVTNGWSIANPERCAINRSDDYGQTWKRVTSAPLRSDPLYAVNSGPGIFYWATNSIDIFSGSFDEGLSWNFLPADPAQIKALRKNTKGHIYFIRPINEIYSELYRSLDGGISFQNLLPELSSANAQFFDLQIGAGGTIYLAVGIPYSGAPSIYIPFLYVSQDDGDHWDKSQIPLYHTIGGNPGVKNASLQLNPVGHLLISFVCEWEPQDGAYSDYCQISSSKNEGKNWEIVYTTADTDIRTWAHSSGILYCYARENNNLWYGASPEPDRRLWSSWDNWKTWQENNWDGGIKEFKEDSDSRLYIVTNYQGIYMANPQALFTPGLVHPASLTPQKTYGVCWIDYNSDGWDDLFFANQGPNELYKNKGDGTFTKITTGAVVTDSEPSRAATWGDYDNDGDADLFVANENANNSLYRNNNDGTFTKITTGELVTSGGASRGCAWGDYDNDGWLDLIVVNRNERNVLYHNLGDGTFQAVANAFGSDISDAFGCSWCDYDLDGDLDLFVANRGENCLYRQTSRGVFARLNAQAFPTDELYSFGGSWGDYDNDAYPDLFVANADGPSALYHNDNNGTFAKTSLAGITTDGSISKGSGWADYDKDGDLDLFVANNGSKFFYRNNGNGTFTAVSSDEFVYYPSNTLSLAWGDSDNDGDQDLLVTSYDQQTVLYHNSGKTGHWLEVKCTGTLSNRSGIGARVSIKTNTGGQQRWQTREINSQSGFAAQSSLSAHFGLGNDDMIDSLRVVWPSGQVQVLTGLMLDECLTINETVVVPVELAYFSAQVKYNAVELQWRTLSEQNNYGFDIERKDEKNIWQKIGFVAGHGTTSEANKYVFRDDSLILQGAYWYRLRIIDTDGQFEFSEIVDITLGLPAVFELLQNYPNPFNASTNIEFTLPTPENVSVRVYSITGEQVKELVNGHWAAGKHEVVWDASHQASGVYLIIFKAGSYHQVRKAVLMK